MSQSTGNSTYPRGSFWETDPSHYTGKPWGTRDLEAKSWQIASSVNFGLSVFYCIRIIGFSLRVSTEQWVGSGCFLWEGKRSAWQSPAQRDVFRRFPTIADIPSAQRTETAGSAWLPRQPVAPWCCHSAPGTACWLPGGNIIPAIPANAPPVNSCHKPAMTLPP